MQRNNIVPNEASFEIKRKLSQKNLQAHTSDEYFEEEKKKMVRFAMKKLGFDKD